MTLLYFLFFMYSTDVECMDLMSCWIHAMFALLVVVMFMV